MSNIISQFTAVFDAIGTWIVTAVNNLIPMFWEVTETGGQLTFMGTLAIIGLGVSICFLLLGIIQRFMKFGA